MEIASSVDEYLAALPLHSKKKLQDLRVLVSSLYPEATESITYGMPAFKWMRKPLVYFAAFNHHIGFYPTSGPIAAFKKELVPYKHAKGSVQFPLDKEMPMDLIKKILEYRAHEISSH